MKSCARNRHYLLQSVRKIGFTLLIGIAVPVMSLGQERSQSPGKPQSSPTDTARASHILVAPDEDYHLGPRDVIEIRIEDAPELSGSFEINSKGQILMFYLGRLSVENKTPEQVSQMIADGLRERYLKDPRVSVMVKQYNSRAFFIQGAVRAPGVYQVEGKPSLLKLITLAGGLADNHGSTAFIIREAKTSDPALKTANAPERPDEVSASGASSGVGSAANGQPSQDNSAKPDDSSYEMLRVKISGLLKGRFDQNVLVEPGDIINIPPTDVFFISGEVHAPGSFSLKEGTTLRQAISLAQGMTFEAAKNRGTIFREDENGKREEIAVDIGAVMEGKKEDLPIRTNDVIIVANSRMKSVSGALLKAFGMTTATRGVPVR